ncbi:MAG: hypothetical protein Q8O64_06315 [Sideroxyarcus sp.]|nr:hypothetical protein [Sideroxyarcus sp.]
MTRSCNTSPDEIKRAKWPHDIFPINLVFKHIRILAATFGVIGSLPLVVLIVPLMSFAISGYISLRANQIAGSTEIAFVKAHWALANKRNKHFMWLLGGAGLLPFMASFLVLIVPGNDSMYRARHSQMPKGGTPSNLGHTCLNR